MISCVSRLLSHRKGALEPFNVEPYCYQGIDMELQDQLNIQVEPFFLYNPNNSPGNKGTAKWLYRRLNTICNWLRFIMIFGPTAQTTWQADLIPGKSNTVVVNLFDIAQANTNRYSVSKPWHELNVDQMLPGSELCHFSTSRTFNEPFVVVKMTDGLYIQW